MRGEGLRFIHGGHINTGQGRMQGKIQGRMQEKGGEDLKRDTVRPDALLPALNSKKLIPQI